MLTAIWAPHRPKLVWTMASNTWIQLMKKWRTTQRSRASMTKWLSIGMPSATDIMHTPHFFRTKRQLRKLRNKKYPKDLWSSRNNCRSYTAQMSVSKTISTKDDKFNSKIISYWSASNHNLWRKVNRYSSRTPWITRGIWNKWIKWWPLLRKMIHIPSKAKSWESTRYWTEKSFLQCQWWTLYWCSTSSIRKFWRLKANKWNKERPTLNKNLVALPRLPRAQATTI